MQPAPVHGILLAGALLIAAAGRSEAIVNPNAFEKSAGSETGAECKFRDNETLGTCHRLPDCPAAIDERNGPLRLLPSGCGFEGKIPLVCCLLAEERSGRIEAESPSVKACASFREYLPQHRPLFPGLKFFRITVVNGTKTAPEEYPHMAVLGYVPTDSSSSSSNTTLSWRCGGTLISAQHVLTAAHCVKRFAPIVIHIGVNDLTNLTADSASNIADIIIHPEYRTSRSYNDIAVIRLREPVSLSQTTRPACLWQPTAATDPESLVATGFGLTEFDGQPSPDLMEVWLRTVPADQCAGKYSKSQLLPHGIQPSQMCAGDMLGYKDTCKGDSGGPLQTEVDELHHVVGVTSFGQGCATQTPAIYTRVSAFVEWIERIVWP